MFKVEHVRLTEYNDAYMSVLLFRQKVRRYYLTVNGKESREYKYHLWFLQKVPLLYKISRLVNSVLAKRRIKRMGGERNELL